MGKDDDDGKHTRVLRWLIDVGRYVVAALVTALTVAAIAKAVTVSLRPQKLYISIVNGTVGASVDTLAKPTQVMLWLKLLHSNPSGRGGIKYQDVNVTLLYQDKRPITWFLIPNGPVHGIQLGPEYALQMRVEVRLDVPDEVSAEFAATMSAPNSRRVENAIVQLNGTLQTQISKLNYTRGHPIEYHCSPVTIGVPRKRLSFSSAGDVFCEEVKHGS